MSKHLVQFEQSEKNIYIVEKLHVCIVTIFLENVIIANITVLYSAAFYSFYSACMEC